MPPNSVLCLSIGDTVPDRRLDSNGYSGHIRIRNKLVAVDISASAVRAAAHSATPILVELELYFSCLLRKQIRFRPLPHPVPTTDAISVLPGIYTRFSAVTTSACTVADAGDQPPTEIMPVSKPERFVPRWIRIDYRNRQWLGEYGLSKKR